MLKLNDEVEKMETEKTETVPVRASHDTQPPQPLIDFMMTGWKEPAKKPAARVQGAARFAARRQALSSLFPGEALVIPTGHEKIRANDTTYRFRPGSDFFYLTGNPEPDCVLVMVPRPAGGHEEILAVEPEVDRSTPAFFTDRARGALWVGPRLGVEGSRVRYGVERTIALPELSALLTEIGRATTPYRVLRGLSQSVDQALTPQAERDQQFGSALSKMRLIKDPSEVAALRKAIQVTRNAFEEAIRALKTAKIERDVEAAFDACARREGIGVGFATIVADGAHAAVLHWTRNDGRIKKGDLVLIDAGAEIAELYTGDITRTLPVSGRFTKEQRAIYDLVTAAQDAAIKVVKPGNDFLEPHRAAMRVLAQGLERLGILPEPAAEAVRDDRQIYKRWTLHNTSHMLGLDVHDGGATNYRDGKLEPGMVLTIEPGLYFQPDDLTIPARYRGVGIRVEEDVLVTPSGCRVLSSNIPRTAKEVEAWMAKVWRGR